MTSANVVLRHHISITSHFEQDEEDTVVDIPITVDDDDTADDVIDPPMSPTLSQKPKKTASQQQKQVLSRF